MSYFSPETVQKVFWTLFSIYAIASLAMIYVVFSGRFRAGPEGPVGAWLVLLPPLALAVVGTLFAVSRSPEWRANLAGALLVPLVLFALGPIQSAFMNLRVDRTARGDDHFTGKQRNLAHAIHANQAMEVRRLLPESRNELNQAPAGQTLLQFALYQVRPEVDSSASAAIVEYLLQAGADPNIPSFESKWPLTVAISNGAAMTSLLLSHGADPNRLDGAGRPLWWDALVNENRLATLEVLLAKGANVSLRDSESGPVGYAGDHGNWAAVRILVEHGVVWQGEVRYGKRIGELFRNRQGS